MSGFFNVETTEKPPCRSLGNFFQISPKTAFASNLLLQARPVRAGRHTAMRAEKARKIKLVAEAELLGDIAHALLRAEQPAGDFLRKHFVDVAPQRHAELAAEALRQRAFGNGERDGVGQFFRSAHICV